MHTASRPLAALLTAALVAGCQQKPVTAPTPARRGGDVSTAGGVGPAGPGTGGGQPGTPGAPGGAPGAQQGPQAEPSPRPYDRVITKEAKSRDGLFRTHRVGSRLYFEIPRKELYRDQLLVARYARSAARPGDFDGYGGDQFLDRVLRWERSGNRVILRSPSYDVTADTSLPVYQAVQASNNPPVVAIFNVEAYGPDSAAVIDVTRLYTTAIPEFVAPRGTIDPQRSFIERAASFPDNIEVEATQTSVPQPTPTPSLPGQPPQQPRGPLPAQSVVAHWSMVRLPAQPMMPRLYDDRVGYFSASQIDFGTEQQRSVERRYITRYRLECSDQKVGDLCVPKKQIVYYVDPATPAKWIPFVKAGIEEWQPAFAAAGFKDGIVAKMPPTASEDADWSPEDVRHTMVRWLPSTVENSVGPHVHDPRTGEILNGSVRMFHNILNLQRDWYFTQVAPLDPRAQKLPLPDSLMGRLLQFVVAHEVGHTLGFQHNMKASSEYPADSVRSASWVARMGHSPSIMDYARFNYVAQPEDRIPVSDLVPKVGVYDRFATMWGYKPIADAKSPDAERATLDQWARMQDTVPWFRFSTSNSRNADPGEETEAVGDADAVKSTGWGLKNIKRIVPMLATATHDSVGDNDDLTEIYDRLLGQWSREMGHVVNVVGGVTSQEKYGSQPGARFTVVPRARQEAAIRFLDENVFHTPTFFLDTAILRRIEPDGAMARMRTAQTGVLRALLDNNRLSRMIEAEALAPGRAYPLTAMLADLRAGVWTELSSGSVRIDPFRRNIQHAYLEQIGLKINPAPTPSLGGQNIPAQFRFLLTPVPDDAQAQMRGDLATLDGQLRAALPRAADAATRNHILDARHEIDRILNPRSDARGN